MSDRSSTLPRQTVTAAVTEELRGQILSGALAEGEQLRQDAIAQREDLSRGHLQQTLRETYGQTE